MFITIRKLAEIAEKSPGYSVLVRHNGGTVELTDIHFERRGPKQRRYKDIVIGTYLGRQARLDSGTLVDIVD